MITCACGRLCATPADVARMDRDGDPAPLIDEPSILRGLLKVSTGWSGELCWACFHPSGKICTRPRLPPLVHRVRTKDLAKPRLDNLLLNSGKPKG